MIYSCNTRAILYQHAYIQKCTKKVRVVSGELDTVFHIHWILKYSYGHCIFYYVCRIGTSKKSLPEETVGNVCIPVQFHHPGACNGESTLQRMLFARPG